MAPSEIPFNADYPLPSAMTEADIASVVAQFAGPCRTACRSSCRLSATDWIEGGWDIGQSVELSGLLLRAGVDLIDCSSGSIVPESRGAMTPGFQIPLAQAVRSGAGIATAAVGAITRAEQGEEALQRGACDIVLLARQLLRDPDWPLRAAQELEGAAPWPLQYLRAVST